MRWLALTLLVPLLSGCVVTDSTTEIMDASAEKEAPRADPIHIDETYPLMANFVDQSWSWTLSEGGSGHIQIDVVGEPASMEGKDNICYEVAWPEGRHARGGCGSGNVNVQIDGSLSLVTGTQNVYEADMYPNVFQMRVWSDEFDTASVRVQIETWYPETA